MSTFIRNATILTLDGPDGTEPFVGSILIEDDAIAAIGPDLVPPADAKIIEGKGRLVMPGLVNAHFHSAEIFFKGRYEHMPLEIWMLYAYPILTNGRIPERLLYLRTMLGAMESLKGGVTTMVDDFFDPPTQDLDRHGVVFDAYEHSGIRARISNNVMDKHVLDTMPFLRELVPAELQAAIAGPEVTIANHEDYCKAAFSSLHGRAGRLSFMVSASAPQRVTVEFMQHCSELAQRSAKAAKAAQPKADPANPNHIGAPMPGIVASVAARPGAEVKKGDLLLTIEAMKMETGLAADRDGTIKAVHVAPGAQIDAKDLLVEMA